jgi:hypothetical protein
VGAGACGRGGSFEVIRRVWSRLHSVMSHVQRNELRSREPPACVYSGGEVCEYRFGYRCRACSCTCEHTTPFDLLIVMFPTRLDLSRTEQRGGPRPSSCHVSAAPWPASATAPPTDQTRAAESQRPQAPGDTRHSGGDGSVPSAQHQQHRPTDTRLGPPNLDCIHRGTVTLELPIDNAHPQEPSAEVSDPHSTRRDELVRARCTPGASRFLPPLFYRQCGLVLLSFIPMLMHV